VREQSASAKESAIPSYTITEVSPQVRDWSSNAGGPMKGYRVSLQNGQGQVMANVEWSRKATSPPPTVGQQVEGDVDTSGQYGPKFKAAQSGGYGGGGGGGRPRDPAERRSIAMQHAQKCAVSVLEVAAAHGDYVPPNAGDVATHVKTIARLLWLQVKDAEDDKIAA
jgi:hypothetical protein